jgi:hypothetical protein
MGPGSTFDFAVEFISREYRLLTNKTTIYKSPSIVHTNKVFVRFRALEMTLKKRYWYLRFIPFRIRTIDFLNKHYISFGVVDIIVPVDRLIFWNSAVSNG